MVRRDRVSAWRSCFSAAIAVELWYRTAKAGCRLCVQPVKGFSHESRFRDSAAARHLDDRELGLGQWYLANRLRIEVWHNQKDDALKATAFRPVLFRAQSQLNLHDPLRPAATQPSSAPASARQDIPTQGFAPTSPPRTSGRPLRTWQDAEDFAEDWMRRNGYPDAHKTPSGGDGGIDVISSGAIAQVKHHAA